MSNASPPPPRENSAVPAPTAPLQEAPGGHTLLAASWWHRFGFAVIPIGPGTKRTVEKWDPWLAKLSRDMVTSHWANHPEHEVGFIVGDGIIVLDADAAESIAALKAIELKFEVVPRLIVKTTRGEHHYFKRTSGTFAKADSHSTTDFPDRIDVKTGRAMVILPPSTGKLLLVCDVNHADELGVVEQDFLDAVFQHNGRPPPRPPALGAHTICEPAANHLLLLEAILRCLDADCGYDDWLHVGMALHHATGSGDAGYALFNSWSSTGEKYRGAIETRTKWDSFRSDGAFTIATLFWLADRAGYSKAAICAELEPFEREGDDEPR